MNDPPRISNGSRIQPEFRNGSLTAISLVGAAIAILGEIFGFGQQSVGG